MTDKIVKNTIIVTLLIVFGKGLSFVRDIVISYYFGASETTDAYFAANNVPSILFTALISSYLILLIPTYKSIQINLGQSKADQFGSSLINFFLVFSSLLSLIGFLFMRELIQLVAPGFDQATYELAVHLGKILVLSFTFSSVTLILSTISNANKKYIAPHIIPVFSSLFVIFGVVLFERKIGIYSLVFSSLLAFVFQMIIQFYISKRHFNYQFKTFIFNDNIKKMTLLALPVFFGYSVDQINLLVNSIISSNLMEGSLSAINYAQRLQLTITGVISTAIITVVYPLLSELTATKDKERFKSISYKSLSSIFIVIVPLALFLAFNSETVIKLVYYRGDFSENDVEVTSAIFTFYAFNVIFISIREFLLRLFYVYSDTKNPLIASAISVLFNILLSLFLVQYFDAAGLSLANMIATMISMFILLIVLFKNKILDFDLHSIIAFSKKIVFPIAIFLFLQYTMVLLKRSNDSILLFGLMSIISFLSYYFLMLLSKQEFIVAIHLKLMTLIRNKIKK